MYIRTEDIKIEELGKYFIETEQDRDLIDKLKSSSPLIVVGSRGIGKSFLLRIAEYEMNKVFEVEKVLPVYITFRKASLLNTPDKNQFFAWMLSKICSSIVRGIREKGLTTNNQLSLECITGNTLYNAQEKTKIEKISEEFENSWKKPQNIVDINALPTVDEFVEVIESLCKELKISRINLLIDEAAHIFIPEQQRQFFTLFRDLRSPYITVNAAVYPGVTIYGDTFQPNHDATIVNYSRDITSSNYVEQMKKLVLKQADNKLQKEIARSEELFAVLAYASGGNPRHLLKSIQQMEKFNSSSLNNMIREYYRNDIWAEHSILAEKYKGMKALIDWGRNFVEDSVLPELKRKNDAALNSDSRNANTTTYFWIHRNAPHLVQEALRILEYTGIITGHSKGVKATKSEIGNRYCINLGCLFALEQYASGSGLMVVNKLSVAKMNEYGPNSKSYADMENIAIFENDLSDNLSSQLTKSIDCLDLTAWQKNKLKEVGINTIGEAIMANEDKIMKAYYVAEKRARQMKNSALAAIYEYLAG